MTGKKMFSNLATFAEKEGKQILGSLVGLPDGTHQVSVLEVGDLGSGPKAAYYRIKVTYKGRDYSILVGQVLKDVSSDISPEESFTLTVKNGFVVAMTAA